MSMIRVDYANARAQAKKLQAAADDCDQVVRQLEGTLSHIPGEWDGAAASAFSAGVQKRLSEISGLADNIRSMAVHIRRVADELEETERRLKNQVVQSENIRINQSATDVVTKPVFISGADENDTL